MYCSNCGNEVKTGLNYCNRCGGKVASEVSGNDSIAQGLSTALGYIGFAGFLAFVGVLALLLTNNSLAETVVMVAALFLATFFGIIFIILKQISKLSEKKIESNQDNAGISTANEIKSPITNQLEEPKQAPASVVENTTRTLDKIRVERK